MEANGRFSILLYFCGLDQLIISSTTGKDQMESSRKAASQFPSMGGVAGEARRGGNYAGVPPLLMTRFLRIVTTPPFGHPSPGGELPPPSLAPFHFGEKRVCPLFSKNPSDNEKYVASGWRCNTAIDAT